MSSTYQLIKGSVPLLISMPHNGEQIPEDVAQSMLPEALRVPDTDWNMDRLYDFAIAMGAYIIKPSYSRYVIDLNRDPNGVDLYPGANSTELCPTTAFDESPLYPNEQRPSKDEIQRRIELYWQPYHQALDDTLQHLKATFGRAVLLEAHSIRSVVPRFFEGQLPDFNFGTASGKSCSDSLIKAVQSINFQPYSMVTDGRFKGGFITRHFGQPEQGIDAIQLELSQRTYMSEMETEYSEALAAQVKPKLQALVAELIAHAQRNNTKAAT
jgi:N-formylglutamate deformylase